MRCERCWSDASQIYAEGQGSGESKTEVYGWLIDQRSGEPCTPEQQAGDYWDAEVGRDTRIGVPSS